MISKGRVSRLLSFHLTSAVSGNFRLFDQELDLRALEEAQNEDFFKACDPSVDVDPDRHRFDRSDGRLSLQCHLLLLFCTSQKLKLIEEHS